MCGKGSSGTSTNTTVTNSDPPEYVAQAYKDLLARATDVANTPLSTYSGATVAGLTDDQLAAFNTIANSQNIQTPYYNSANSALQASQNNLWNGVQTYSPEAISQYYNPYLNDVINSTMANINETNAQQQTQLQGNAISSGAWGGDRAGVAAAELARQQGLAANQTLANLQSEGYTNAQNMFQQQQAQQLSTNQAQAGLNQNAATGYSNLGTSAQNASLQGASAQLQSGALQQQQEQNILNVPYQQWQAQQSYPFETTQFLENAVFGLPSSGTTSSTSTGTSPAASTTSQLAGLGLTGLSLYGALSGSKNGGRVGYANGGITGKPKKYLYGGYVMNSGVPNMASGYVPAGKQYTPHNSMLQPSGSVATGKTEGTKSDQTSLGDLAKAGPGVYKGSKLLAGKVKDYLSNPTANTDSLLYSPSGASWDQSVADQNFLNPVSGDVASGDAFSNAANSGASFSDALNASRQAGATGLDAMANQSAMVNGIGGSGDTFSGIAAVPDVSQTGVDSALNAAAETSGISDTLLTGAEGLGIGAGSKYGLEALGVDKNTASTIGTLASLAFFLLNKGGTVPYKTMDKKKKADGGSLSDNIADLLKNDPQSPGILLNASSLDAPISGQSFPMPTLEPNSTAVSSSNADSGTGDADISVASPTQATPDVLIPTNQSSGTQIYQPKYVTPEIPKYEKQTADPWMALLTAGLGMAAGTSHNAITNIAQGGLMGANAYTTAKNEANQMNYKNMGVQEAAAKLINESEWRKQQATIQSKNAETKQNAEARQEVRDQRSLDLKEREIGLQQQKLNNHDWKLVPDQMGGFVNYNPKTHEVLPVEGLGAQNVKVDPNTGEPLTGDAYLATLPIQQANQVKAFAEGKIAAPSGYALKSPYWQNMMRDVSLYDPNFDTIDYNARAKTRQAFTSGAESKQINALNTVAQHMGQLNEAVDNLNNSSWRGWNSIKNWASKETGNPDITNFEAIKKNVVDELTRVWRGTGGSEADIQERLKVLDSSNSPQQLKGALRETAQMVKGKIDAFSDQYRRGMGTAAEDKNFYTPETINIFKSLGVDIGGENRGGSQQQTSNSSQNTRSVPAVGTVMKGYKFKGGDPSDKNNWEKVQ